MPVTLEDAVYAAGVRSDRLVQHAREHLRLYRMLRSVEEIIAQPSRDRHDRWLTRHLANSDIQERLKDAIATNLDIAREVRYQLQGLKNAIPEVSSWDFRKR